MSNIKQLLAMKGEDNAFIKGGEIDKNGVFHPINNGYGLFTIKPEYTEGNFNIIPIVETMLGLSEENDKAKFIEFSQTIGNIPGSDGKTIIDGSKLVKKGCELYGYNYDELTGKTAISQNPDDIVKSVLNEEKGIPNDSSNPMSPDYIPPAQRSGVNNPQVPIIGGISS